MHALAARSFVRGLEIRLKATGGCCKQQGICFVKRFDYVCSVELCLMHNCVLIVSLRRRLTSWTHFRYLTFNFNSLLGIVYVSFSMQFPTVEECDFDRQFLFDEYVAISHRYDLKRVSLWSYITALSSYVKTELFSHVYDARQPVEFP
jgi:hypothetical protein